VALVVQVSARALGLSLSRWHSDSSLGAWFYLVILKASDEVRRWDSGGVYQRCPKNLNLRFLAHRRYTRRLFSPTGRRTLVPPNTQLPL